MEEIVAKLKNVFKELFDAEIEPEVTPAPENFAADFASNIAMKMAGELHAAPREIAEKVAEKFNVDGGIKAEVAGPGFLNFILSDEYWKGKLADFAGDFEKNISCDEYFGKTVICEFSDPNPFKVLHVGHLYTSIVGDSISRLVEFAGGKVVRANFGGDVGLHVSKTLWAVRRDGQNTDDIETIAKAYVEGTRAYDDDEAAHAEITKLNKEIYRVAAENDHEGELAELYWRGREVSYKYFEDFYARVGVKFDKYYPESSVAGRGLAEVSAQVGKTYEKSDGAVIFPGEKYGLHTRVFINKEGLPTYETKDVGLIFTKFDDYHFDKSIVITGNEQSEYMKVVLCSIRQYAPELVERTTHLTHGMVRLPGNAKMSSRKGNFIKAVDVLDEVSGMVSDEKIAMAAIKYAFLKYKIGGNIEFDAKESVSTTGNSGVYLQYSAVRAAKILEKLNSEWVSASADAVLAEHMSDNSGWNLNGHEKNLIKKLAQYSGVLKEAVSDFAPHKLANYLYETAQEFSRFYENVKVAGAPEEAERTKIVKVYHTIMTHGLNLLGIEVPEEM